MSMDGRLVALIDEIYALIKDPSGLKDLVERIADWRGAGMALLTAPPLPGCTAIPLMAYKLDFTPVLTRPDLLMRPEFNARAVATGRAPGVFTLHELMSRAGEQRILAEHSRAPRHRERDIGGCPYA